MTSSPGGQRTELGRSEAGETQMTQSSQSFPLGGPTSTSRRARRVFQSQMGGTERRSQTSDQPSQQEEAMVEANFIYGTTINEATARRQIREFFLAFKEEGAEEPKYIKRLDKLLDEANQKLTGGAQRGEVEPVRSIFVDGMDVHEFDQQLYNWMVNFPSEIVPCMDSEVWQLALKRTQEAPEFSFQCKVLNLMESEQHPMRDLNPEHLETMVSIAGVVMRCSDLIPEMDTGYFKCMTVNCSGAASVALHGGRIQAPATCPECNAKYSMTMIHNESTFTNKQLVKVQEAPESIPQGETPQTVVVYAFDDLYDVCQPGDRVNITGIFRASPVPLNNRARNVRDIYRTFVDALNIQPSTTSENEVVEFEEEDIAKFKSLAESPTLVDQLVNSLAPSIWELEDVKKGLLCQLFGAPAMPHARGDINILLCGDPSTAKSQFLGYVHTLAPRGVKAVGSGSSAVGLTAYVTRDPDTRELVLESGALVLSDRGVCCIDEFDKMPDQTKAILHEVMEQQTVSVAKAGIVCSLNARTAVLACANPKHSRWDEKISVIDNLTLSPNLISRFDLIYLMLDRRDESTDIRLATHITRMFGEGMSTQAEPPLEPKFMQQYIAYARSICDPAIVDGSEAERQIQQTYKTLRREGSASGQGVVSVTVRNLESLIRLSKSLARMSLCKEVGVEHVDEAMRLIRAATFKAAVDPTTGKVDMSLLATGMSASRVAREQSVQDFVTKVFQEGPVTMKTSELLVRVSRKLSEAGDKTATDAEIQKALRFMSDRGMVRASGSGSDQQVTFLGALAATDALA
mmetsp:Transcript_26801/g.64550  ORF Transcript_26801/g.64550 Transcript_26801/m.64550 type:complete len:801 (-) Transcript_26801:143-2545(-)